MNCTLQKSLQEKFLALANRRRVAVLGNGVTGRGIQKLLKKLNLHCVFYDEDPQRGELLTVQNLRLHDIVIGSPSFLLQHPWRRLIAEQNKWYLPELDFGSLWIQAPIVAITGTNGKTTTTSFLTEIFNHCSRRAFSVGNIGRPLSELVATEDVKKDDIIFCETSSFQAESISLITPSSLIWTNFAPNHLNHHRSLRDYFEAKYRLVQRLLVGKKNVTHHLFAGESVAFWAKHFCFPVLQSIRYIRAKKFLHGTSFDDFPQLENYAMVESFCHSYGILPEIVFEMAAHFQRPKYRLENMGVFHSNTYWNDSKCTNFAALRVASNSFPGSQVIWIGGGRSKGEDLEEIVDIVRGKVEQAILIGLTGKDLETILRRKISLQFT